MTPAAVRLARRFGLSPTLAALLAEMLAGGAHHG